MPRHYGPPPTVLTYGGLENPLFHKGKRSPQANTPDRGGTAKDVRTSALSEQLLDRRAREARQPWTEVPSA